MHSGQFISTSSLRNAYFGLIGKPAWTIWCHTFHWFAHYHDRGSFCFCFDFYVCFVDIDVDADVASAADVDIGIDASLNLSPPLPAPLSLHPTPTRRVLATDLASTSQLGQAKMLAVSIKPQKHLCLSQVEHFSTWKTAKWLLVLKLLLLFKPFLRNLAFWME